MRVNHFVAVVVLALCVVTLEAQERKLKLGKDSSRNRSSDSDSKSDSDRPKQTEPRSINGTNLKTRTLYRIGVKPFPYGVLANSPAGTIEGQHRYLKFVNDRKKETEFRDPEALFTQWEFVPVSSDNRYNWYKLRNRGLPKEYVTWKSEDWKNSRMNLLILESNYPGNRSKNEFLFRPVKLNQDNDVGQESKKEKDYYQLISKKYRTGIVSVTYLSSPMEYYYLEFVDPVNANRRKKYDEGNDMHDFTLFTFELAVKEDIKDKEDIDDIKVDDIAD